MKVAISENRFNFTEPSQDFMYPPGDACIALNVLQNLAKISSFSICFYFTVFFITAVLLSTD